MNMLEQIVKTHMDNYSKKNRMTAEIAIIKYMEEYGLTAKDIKEYGKAIHYIDAHKIEYVYKNDIICTIDLHMDISIKTPYGTFDYSA